MVFLDTSAIYALADLGDPNHGVAKARFQGLLAAGEHVFTHSYVLVESMALLQRRLGLETALKLAESARAFEIEWVDRAIHEEAVQHLARSRARPVSLVDHVSFLVMRRHGVETALAFDRDFVEHGFRLYGTEADR